MLVMLFSCSLRVGFDEWFGNLYHLNAEEEPDYPGQKNPEYKTKFGPETDLMAMRVDAWKMHIGVSTMASWFDEKSYPSVPYITNLLMDPIEEMTPDSEEFAYEGCKFVAEKLWCGEGTSR